MDPERRPTMQQRSRAVLSGRAYSVWVQAKMEGEKRRRVKLEKQTEDGREIRGKETNANQEEGSQRRRRQIGWLLGCWPRQPAHIDKAGRQHPPLNWVI